MSNPSKIIDESWQLRRKKRYREAELILHEALPHYHEGSYEHGLLKTNLAGVLLQQGNAEEARALALEVLEKMPTQTDALTVLGSAALKMNQTSEAVENLQKAYSRVPNPYRAGRLARALELDGQKERALALLKEALQKFPQNGYLLKQYAYLNKTVNPAPESDDSILKNFSEGDETSLSYAEYLKSRLQDLEPEEAARQLQKIIKVGKRKDNPHLHLAVGELWRKAGDDKEAVKWYRKALELDPGNSYTLSQQIFAYRRLGMKETAWPLLKNLVSQNPGDRPARAVFIKDARELGRNREAVEHLEEILKQSPGHKELYGAIRKLRAACIEKQEGTHENR